MNQERRISFEPFRSTKEVEILPGILERRHFLRTSLVGAAAVVALRATTIDLFAQDRPPQLPAKSIARLAWDDFLKEAVPVARQLLADPGFSVDEYLYRIGSLATRLEAIPETKLFPLEQLNPRVFFAPSFKGSPFFIIQWRMEPGAILPPHNHPNASVCTFGFEGEIRLRNFEIEGQAPAYESGKIFRLRETHNEPLTPGRINTLSPARDNIHTFRAAKQGARGIDISTLHGPSAPFSFVDINEEPIDPESRIFEATWNDLGRRATPLRKN